MQVRLVLEEAAADSYIRPSLPLLEWRFAVRTVAVFVLLVFEPEKDRQRDPDECQNNRQDPDDYRDIHLNELP
ncbi:hypothetical protein EPN90_04475 [Patescibacteria group bacterium]|nr:MAG: hypothetical protein EPN90_04475 [Patescibacteria group bacterium]